MYNIGEFSKITGLTVKTLRFYHEQNLLTPSRIDPQSGYRFYDAAKVETARIIKKLRDLEFSLAQIAEILQGCDDEADVLEHLERHKRTIAQKMRRYRHIERSLDQIISIQKEASTAMTTATFQIEEKSLEPLLVASIRIKGKYSDCGKGFAQIARRFGRHLAGKPLMLHHDAEYRETDADFEACFPIRQGKSIDNIVVRQLPAVTVLTLVHKGPYDELGRSYARLLDAVKEKNVQVQLPTRELYLKGPGMIFKGNPRKYLTELQIPFTA